MLMPALQWIKRNTIPGSGVVTTSRQRDCYPEVSGYLIPTLLSAGEYNLAMQYSNWLRSIQNSDGSFRSGDGRAYAFDTGQVVRGWNAMLEHDIELEMPLRRACDWLIDTADPATGRLVVPPPGNAWNLGARGEVSEGIHLYALAPLKKAGELLGKTRYLSFTEKALAYYRRLPLTDFRLPAALTHFFAYVQDALTELGLEDLARQGMGQVAVLQRDNGAVPGYADVGWVCSTGLAQLAIVWYRLGEGVRADAALGFLGQLQNESGGFYSSYGVRANYFPAEEIAWAAKYAIDAAHCQIAGHFDSTAYLYTDSIAPADGRARAIVRHLGDLNGKTVLDAGSGKGRYSRLLHGLYPQARITALDVSAEMLAHVPEGIRKVQNGILDMPFADGSFDAVICVEALEHVVNTGEGIRELGRVLAPGGKLVIIDKNIERLGALQIAHWEKWFARSDIERMMSDVGLQVISEFVAYDQLTEPDGLFICWVGHRDAQPRAAQPREAAVAPTATSVANSAARKESTTEPDNRHLIGTFDPSTLLGDRLGLSLYAAVAKSFLNGRDTRLEQLYQRFVAHFNETNEHSPDIFRNLVETLARVGFDWLRPVYGNPKEFTLLNGSHRVAASIALGLAEIPYSLRFEDSRIADEVFPQIFNADEIAWLREQQEALIAACDPLTAFQCRVRRHMRANPASFKAPFSSKTRLQGVLRTYQGSDRLGIRGKRQAEARHAVYGFRHWLPADAKVLEMGCNVGMLSLEVARSASRVIAFDVDPAYIALANMARDYLGLRHCTFQASGIEQFRTEEKFDCVIACSIHGWISLPFGAFVEKVRSLLVNGGYFLIESHEIDFHPEWKNQREHLTRYFDVLRSGIIDGVDAYMYESEIREYLVLKMK